MGVRAADIAVRVAPARAAHRPRPRLSARFALAKGRFTLDVDLRLPARGISVLFGASGAGKTTLLRCIAGLERTARGSLRLGELCWQDSARGLWTPPHRRGIGYVFQDAALLPHLDVRGNLGYARRRAHSELIALDDAIEWLGLQALLDRRPAELSGGESRRVAIARALVNAPQLLLMDEPLAGLDRPARRQILPLLERLHSELSLPILYVTHSATETARLADHVVLLKEGRTVAGGTPNEMSTRIDLPIAHAEDAAAVVETVVAAHDDEYALTTLRFSGGHLIVPRQPLACGRPLRVRIAARDVSISLDGDARTSILNNVAARVASATELDSSRMLVKLDAGGTLLLAQITRKSHVTLGLRPGLRVHTQVKSVALVD